MKILARYVSSLLFIAFLFVPIRAMAQGVQDFVITKFDASYELSNEDPQGLLTTKETIDLNFSGQNHGILRAIPQKYGDVDTHPKVKSVMRDGNSEPYVTYTENDNLVLRIGDAGKFITGVHNYVIEYAVENVITFYDDHDELFWDVNGNDWLQTFESVSASLVDTGSGPTTANPGVACFTGSFGSTERSCEVLPGSRSFSVHTTRPLHASETLTFVAAFSKGYFTPMSWAERYREWLIASPAFLLQLFAVRSAHKKWQKLGKDPKKRGITVPYFERPKGMSVMQAAYVLENRLLPKHISATIIDLAVRGYLKIVEEKQRFSTKHQLILQKLPDSENTEGEKILVNELFDTVSVGSTVKLEDKKNKLYKALDTLTKHIDEKSAQAGYYQLSPKKAGGKFIAQIGLAVLALIAGFIFADSTNGVSVMTGFATLIAIIIYGASMTKRSVEGNMLVEHMEGVKLYLNQAEKDRIKNQDAVAAPLSPHSGEPMRDVKFFEKLLPFAVAMGVEKTWAKAFADIYSQPPDWYSGNWRTFSAVALADSLSKTTTATASAFSSPSSSGGSGFGGGGGAGGGGGGGGGGGW